MANYENFDFIDTTAKDNEIAAVNKYEQEYNYKKQTPEG